MRIDLYLVDNGYYKSRELAKLAIDNGLVKVDGKVVTKPSFDYTKGLIEVSEPLKFVSRGGYKLECAINSFYLDFKDKVIVDIGSSTGGFTDCSLQNGAKLVYAIDIGTDQLDPRLLTNDKVISMEQTNFLDIEAFDLDIDYYVSDVSFISIKKILEHLNELDAKDIIILIKPQFEVEMKFLNKNGVLKDRSKHYEILKDINSYINSLGYKIHKITPSPIKGKSGNIEYLAYVKRESNSNIDLYLTVKKAFGVD
ncbi:MAG: TlyA family RNA methyltransferase [Acholeplasmatales bacterium]|nr:TlyA family RNA methyltransferase [Acholeplasmatales bacterium]